MKKTKLLAVVLLMLILIKNTMVFAKLINIGETKYIERGDQGFYSIQYWNENYENWYYVTYSKTYYTDNDGQQRIAYCCMPDANGVGWIPGEYDGYDTTIQYKLSKDDEKQRKLWRVFKNGYPYVSPSQLGVETDDDAYLATKQAAYFIIRERSEDEVYNYFRPGEDYVEGQDLEETQRRGQKVIDAIYKLVYKGNSGKEEMDSVHIDKIGDIKKEDDYSFQEYKVISSSSEDKIKIKSIDNCPDGTIIIDKDGESKDTFYGGEVFRVKFKNSSIDKNFDITIKYTVSCKNYPVFYAKSSIEGTQDYLLTVEKFDDEDDEIKLKIDSKKCGLELKKVDEKNKEPIPGVKFKIEYKNREKIGEYTTNEDGLIILEDLKPEKIIITEIEAPSGYVLNSTPQEIQLKYNEVTKIEINNKENKPEEKKEEKIVRKNKKLPRTGF